MILENPNFDGWILFDPIRPYLSLDDQISRVCYHANPHIKIQWLNVGEAPMPSVDQTWCETPIPLLNCVFVGKLCFLLPFLMQVCEFY